MLRMTAMISSLWTTIPLIWVSRRIWTTANMAYLLGMPLTTTSRILISRLSMTLKARSSALMSPSLVRFRCMRVKKLKEQMRRDIISAHSRCSLSLRQANSSVFSRPNLSRRDRRWTVVSPLISRTTQAFANKFTAWVAFNSLVALTRRVLARLRGI